MAPEADAALQPHLRINRVASDDRARMEVFYRDLKTFLAKEPRLAVSGALPI